MGSIKKALGAVVLASVMVAGGFAVSVALAATHSASGGWTPGNCSAAAQNAGARSKTITAIYSGIDANGASCSLTIAGKFTGTLPAKNAAMSAFVRVAAAAGTPETYTGTIKTKTFHGTLELAVASPLTITQNTGCGWTYIWQGGHWVALYTTC